MAITILDSKLHIPSPRPGRVPRTRLLSLLDEGLLSGARVSLISAPAGFGKSTLAADWAASSGRPVAWLSLEEEEREGPHLLAYLVAAFRRILAGAPGLSGLETRLARMIRSPGTYPAETILAELLNGIDAVPVDFLLVIDDCHLASGEAFAAILAFIAGHLPARMHLAIATREDPPLPLARLRARGQLTELRERDLRLTLDEATGFLNGTMGLSLAPDRIAALEARTEGWVAGLQMAALSLKGKPGDTARAQDYSGSHRFAVDYLIEEVLEGQSERVRDFLLSSSILDRCCGPLCGALAGEADGSALLRDLAAANLFLIPLDDEGLWYRYHSLFLEALRARLVETQPDRVPRLHGIASEWFERNGLRTEAVRHALAARQHSMAADLLELAWPSMEADSRIALWLEWVRALPDDELRDRPLLCIECAFALMGYGELEAAEARLDQAEALLNAKADRSAALAGSIALGRAYISQARGDVPSTVTQAERALELLPETDTTSRGQARGLLGITRWAMGDLEAAYRVFSDYSAKLIASGNIPDALTTSIVLLELWLATGRLREAESSLSRLLRIAGERCDPIPPESGYLDQGLMEIFLERGDMENAALRLRLAEERGALGSTPWPYRLGIARARLERARGKLESALDQISGAELCATRMPLPDPRPLAALRARIWIEQGRLDEALAWSRERGLSSDGELHYLREYEHMTLARLLLALGNKGLNGQPIHEASRLLERLRLPAEEGQRTGSLIELDALRALALDAAGNTRDALKALGASLRIAEPEGYVRLYVDEGLPMARLLREAFALGIAPAYVRRLLSSFPEESPGRSAPQAREALSEREVEVLRLINAGLSNEKIADRLFLSLNTVKVHTRNIFGKLGAHHRAEALAKAREAGILP